ncbi:MAG: MBL fold metallo-hydrolase [Candidatus Hodarchaeales archaeon]|jgi:L-ascorbate metabolism protein UlaG (beta-lactamase superfamily)
MSEKKADSQIIDDIYKVPLDENEVTFTYFGWAGIILRTKSHAIALDIGEKSLQKDQLSSIKNLDLQLYSHTHWDHYSLPVTKKIFETTKAPVIAEPQVATELKDNIPADKLRSLQSGDTLSLDGFEIKAIAGIHPRPITLFRVKWKECNLFHGADSGYIPLKNYLADLAFIPTGSPSPSCSPQNALKMVVDIKPQVVVAMHGTNAQMQKFKSLVNDKFPDTKIILPEMKKIIKFTL